MTASPRLAAVRLPGPDDAPRGFHALLRWLEARHPDHPRIGTGRCGAEEVVRLGQPPDLAFAPAALADVRAPAEGAPWAVDVRFLGLWGPQGPMPLHLAETVRERARRRPPDEAWRDFADLFHHRLLSVLYRAWAAPRAVCGADRSGRDDPFAERLAAIGGPLAPWPGAAAGAPSRGALAAWASEAFGVPATVATWHRVRLPWPRPLQCRLGRRGSRLGVDAMLGASRPDVTGSLLVTLAVPDAAALRSLQGDAAAAARARLEARVSPWRRLVLRTRVDPAGASPVALGRRSATLGRDAWLGAGTAAGADTCRDGPGWILGRR